MVNAKRCIMFMNNKIRETLEIIPKDVIWNFRNSVIYMSLFVDTIKPITDKGT